MPMIQVETEQLLHAALQMPRAELEQFVTRLLALTISQDTAHVSQAASALLLTINQGIPSATQQRLDALIAKRQAHTRTVEEHQELLQLTQQIEQRRDRGQVLHYQSGNTFRDDSTSGQYICNVATQPLSEGTWYIRIASSLLNPPSKTVRGTLKT
jgi:hypothetical protein